MKKLIEILQKLVDNGNTVIVIEHNMDLIKSSDYIIDIGPEGGDKGGADHCKGNSGRCGDERKILHGKIFEEGF